MPCQNASYRAARMCNAAKALHFKAIEDFTARWRLHAARCQSHDIVLDAHKIARRLAGLANITTKGVVHFVEDSRLGAICSHWRIRLDMMHRKEIVEGC